MALVIVALALSTLAGAAIGSQSAARDITPVPTPSLYLSSLSIPNAGTLNQVWMDRAFCVRGWWYDDDNQLVRLCSEYKADTPVPGANYKIDLPGLAALALIGNGTRWELSAVAMARPDMLPGPNFVPVSGPTLVTVLSLVTPSPVLSPPATVTPPPDGATATPTVVSGATFTPGGTPTPTRSTTGTPQVSWGNMCDPQPTPLYPHQMVIVGIKGAQAPSYVWWCIPPNSTPDLVIAVPLATFEASYDNGPRQLLQDLGR